MVESEPPRPGSRSRNNVRDEWLQASAGASSDECELCQTEARTSRQYGLRVCDACDRKYLP